MDSEKEFDNCGVCGGDGSSCDLKVGTIKKTPEKGNYVSPTVVYRNSSLGDNSTSVSQ